LHRRFLTLCWGLALVHLLSGCAQDHFHPYREARATAPIPPKTLSLMLDKGMQPGAPILMRAFKKEAEIEIWKQDSNGQFALLKTFPICRWSGQLGPKIREGDRQAPEGFYEVSAGALNPNSSLFLSFNIGFPNAFDRANNRTGAHLMVHGACSSQGCFAMTDEAISEMYAITRESLVAGQQTFQFQSFPFRMTPDNLARHRADQNIAFWRNLKEGSDIFEVTRQAPKWKVYQRRYAFELDSMLAAEIDTKRTLDARKEAELISKGTPAIRLVYHDGGGHPSLRKLALAAANLDPSLDARTRESLGQISRPEALAKEPEEVSATGPEGTPPGARR
jgi:murein L,D-transpeptidase YafK